MAVLLLRRQDKPFAVQRLLLLELHRLGDAVMGLPLLRAAAERYEVHVGCSPYARPLYDLVLPPERIVTVERRLSARTFQALRRVRADVAVSPWADTRDHLFFRALGIPRRAGFPMNRTNYYAHHLPWRARSLLMGLFLQGISRTLGLQPLTDPVQRDSYRQHHVEDGLQLARALGLAPRADTPWLDLPEGPLPAPLEEFLDAHAGKDVWLLHPGAARASRQWPHYARLVAEVFAPRRTPLICLQLPGVPPLEAPYAECLAWPSGSLLEFFRLASRCGTVLGNDSAAAHVGSAFGKRVVTIFGPGSSDWFAPYAARTLILESDACPVRPCFDRCVQPSYLCLEDMTYAKVARGIAPLLDTPSFPS